MSKKRVTVVLIALVVTVWNAAVYYVDMQLEKRSHENVYNSCHKIWSSRGLYNSHDERNSITSFRRAFEHGALGAEVDFSYDVKMDRFIVSHGHPKKDADGSFIYPKKDGELLTLERLFKAVGEKHYFWLDYKNLDRLNAQETEQAIRRLLNITQVDLIKERLYIEGSNPLKLSEYTTAGFKTILGIRLLPEKNIFSSVAVNSYKMVYYFINITALAMPYGKIDNPLYGKDSEKRLLTIPIFLFHVPDNEDLLYGLMHINSVQALLVGRDKSIDRFYINNCLE